MANSQNKPIQLETSNSLLTAEEKLWKSVMATAIYDALHKPNRVLKVKHKVFTEETDIKSARNWFKYKEGTFETVCEALNLDPDRVHKTMTRKINQILFQERLGRI
jgi:hypothetical protein